MSQKYLEKKLCVKLKPELLTMQVHKYGTTNPMMLNQIYGHLDVSCTSLLISSHLLELGIWRDSSKKLLEAIILGLIKYTLRIYPISWNAWSKWTQRRDSFAVNILLYRSNTLATFCQNTSEKRKRHWVLIKIDSP